MADIIGNNFGAVKFQRKKRVTPLQVVRSSIKIDDEIIPVDPATLFQRISLVKKADAELKRYFKYKLAPYPLALFDEFGMRKTKKSVMLDLFTPVNHDMESGNDMYVIDGGFLLHRVVWHQQGTFSQILMKYVDYVTKYYSPNGIIVFDGYPNDASMKGTKSAEHLRRTKKVFQPTSSLLRQCLPLSRKKNSCRMTRIPAIAGFVTKQAVEDADVLIVKTAIEAASSKNLVFIIGEDVDLLVPMTALASDVTNISFLKPSKGKVQQVVYAPSSFKYRQIVENLLFVRAFSGCDTTSVFFRQGKIIFAKIIANSTDLQTISKVFKNPDRFRDK